MISLSYSIFQKYAFSNVKKTTHNAAKNIGVELYKMQWDANNSVLFCIETLLSMLLTGITYVGKAWFIYLHKNMSLYIAKYLCL